MKNDLTQEAIKLVQSLLSKDPDYLQGYFTYNNYMNKKKIIQMPLKLVKKGYD